MFKFRFGGQGSSSPMQPPTIETVRRRARHRLLGASVLVLAGVIGFPLLFESQPRPVQADFEIDIPARDAAKPRATVPDTMQPSGVRVDGLDESEEVVGLAPAAAPAPAVQPAAPAGVAGSPNLQAPREEKPVAKPEAKPQADARPPEKKPEPKPVEPKLAEKPAKPAKPVDDSARALALLEGKPIPQDKPASDDKSAAKSRHIVQVGAFVDPALAQEARMKLERIGLTTYTQITNTPDGPRTRVRLGPFATRDEAAKAAAKARTLGLSASILTL